jgi:hypothetical protein
VKRINEDRVTISRSVFLLLQLLRGISLHFYLISCLAQQASIILDEEKKKKSLRFEKNIKKKIVF